MPSRAARRRRAHRGWNTGANRTRSRTRAGQRTPSAGRHVHPSASSRSAEPPRRRRAVPVFATTAPAPAHVASSSTVDGAGAVAAGPTCHHRARRTSGAGAASPAGPEPRRRVSPARNLWHRHLPSRLPDMMCSSPAASSADGPPRRGAGAPVAEVAHGGLVEDPDEDGLVIARPTQHRDVASLTLPGCIGLEAHRVAPRPSVGPFSQ
jgi:hypothetical protein